MKLFIIITTLLLSFNLNAKCKQLNKVVNIGTEVISQSFNCIHLDIIKEDIRKTIEISGICKMGFPMRNVKPKTLCKALGGYAGVLTVNVIPQRWGCLFIPNEHQAYSIKIEVIDDCLKEL